MEPLFEESYGEGTMLEWIPSVKSFCYFVSLKKATSIVGYTQMIFYGFLVILNFYDLVIWADIYTYDELWIEVPRAMDVNALPRCMFGALLPYGIHKQSHGYILAWLLAQQPLLLENISWYIMEEIPFYILVMKSWVRVILALGEIGFNLYVVVVVNSYYKSVSLTNQVRPIAEQSADQ